MLLLDFISSQFFGKRDDQVKKEDLIKLVASINGVIDTFKKVADEIENSRSRHPVKIPIMVDDTFN